MPVENPPVKVTDHFLDSVRACARWDDDHLIDASESELPIWLSGAPYASWFLQSTFAVRIHEDTYNLLALAVVEGFGFAVGGVSYMLDYEDGFAVHRRVSPAP